MGSAVLVLLALVGSGLGYVSLQTGAASSVADMICARLQSQDYGSLYNSLAADDRAKESSAQAGQLLVNLDRLEGKVSSCHQVSGAYQYSFGSSSATTQLTMTRGTIGVLQGKLVLHQESGTWRAVVLTTALLGINPSALAAAEEYCSALRSQQYSGLPLYVGSGTGLEMDTTSFEKNAVLQDKYDGSVASCTITQVGSGNTDAIATITMSITRPKTGTSTGQVTLVSNSGTWTLARADAAILGKDYRPVLVGSEFCSDLQAGKISSAYSLFTSGFQEKYSLASFEPDFDTSGWNFYCRDPDMSTYSIANGEASYHLKIEYSGVDAFHNSGTLDTTLYFELNSGQWKLDGFEYHPE